MSSIQPVDVVGADAPAIGAADAIVRKHSISQILAGGFLTAVIVFAVVGPLIVRAPPNQIDLSQALQGPSPQHWLGTDDIGRDQLSRLVAGAKLEVIASLQGTAIAVGLGLPLGLLSGYLGGWVDTAIMRFVDVVMVFPFLIMAVAIVGFLGPGLGNAMVAVGIVFAPLMARVVRSATLTVREENYVKAARLLRASDLHIMRKHILPNILHPVLVQVTLTFGMAILAESSLSFLGLGAQPPQASWGAMLERSFSFIQAAPLNVLTPGLLITLTILSINVLGDGLQQATGRERRRSTS